MRLTQVLNRKWVGADPHALAEIAGLNIDSKVEMLIAETDFNDAFVQEEQMMALLPIVRANVLTRRWTLPSSPSTATSTLR